MIMGILILKKNYTLSKYLSVFMITLGISVCTVVSGKDVVSTDLELLKNCLYSAAFP
jgi:UDP-xylose/UDP-N-acetylglucosamine transporter B4